MNIFLGTTNNAYELSKWELGEKMIWLKEYFSIYIDFLILAIGAYMALVQSKNLDSEETFKREGRFSRTVGYIYIVIGIGGIIITSI